MTDTICRSDIHKIDHNGREIYLIGTAHISEKSAQLVEETIRELKPDTVCVELCDARLEALSNPNRWKETDLFQIIRTGKSYLLMAQLALASYQKRLAKEFNIRPGEEMHTAIRVAEEIGSKIEVVDRDIKLTLKRAWAKSSLWSMFKIFGSLLASMFSSEELSAEDIEKLKEGDALSNVLSELSGHLPEVKEALVDERDSYMSYKIGQAPGRVIVAVLGAGHIPGIKKLFGNEIDIEELETIPPRRFSIKALAWGIPIAVVVMIAFGFYRSGIDTSVNMVTAWILANSVLTAIGAIIALAHPLTILAAIVASPLTSLNPTIGAGWVCGLVEAIIRKPRVKDLEGIGDDVLTTRGIWKNRVSRILLVIALTTLGSMLGSVVGFSKIAALLSN